MKLKKLMKLKEDFWTPGWDFSPLFRSRFLGLFFGSIFDLFLDFVVRVRDVFQRVS